LQLGRLPAMLAIKGNPDVSWAPIYGWVGMGQKGHRKQAMPFYLSLFFYIGLFTFLQ